MVKQKKKRIPKEQPQPAAPLLPDLLSAAEAIGLITGLARNVDCPFCFLPAGVINVINAYTDALHVQFDCGICHAYVYSRAEVPAEVQTPEQRKEFAVAVCNEQMIPALGTYAGEAILKRPCGEEAVKELAARAEEVKAALLKNFPAPEQPKPEKPKKKTSKKPSKAMRRAGK